MSRLRRMRYVRSLTILHEAAHAVVGIRLGKRGLQAMYLASSTNPHGKGRYTTEWTSKKMRISRMTRKRRRRILFREIMIAVAGDIAMWRLGVEDMEVPTFALENLQDPNSDEARAIGYLAHLCGDDFDERAQRTLCNIMDATEAMILNDPEVNYAILRLACDLEEGNIDTVDGRSVEQHVRACFTAVRKGQVVLREQVAA